MKVLVAYATRHGATREIAERIARTLERPGLEVALRPVDQAGAIGEYDAFVVGAAAYMFHWLNEATSFVRRNRSSLVSHPVWLFSSGPLGTERLDADGHDLLEAAVPREFAELATEIRPRGQQVFFGAYDPNAKPVGVMERLTRLMPAAREALPAGDFRDWPAIEAWAEGVGRELHPTATARTADEFRTALEKPTAKDPDGKVVPERAVRSAPSRSVATTAPQDLRPLIR